MQLSRNADEIIPGLWLGNLNAAADAKFLRENKIHAVFNFTKNLPFVETVPKKYRIPVDDNLQPDEIRNLELWSVKFVPQILEELLKGPILLHCHAGMQRSAAGAAMTLVRLLGISSANAMAYIQMKRPIAFTPGANFLEAIKGYESHLQSEEYKRAVNSM
jgi:dual specificity phosphatase 12